MLPEARALPSSSLLDSAPGVVTRAPWVLGEPANRFSLASATWLALGSRGLPCGLMSLATLRSGLRKGSCLRDLTWPALECEEERLPVRWHSDSSGMGGTGEACFLGEAGSSCSLRMWGKACLVLVCALLSELVLWVLWCSTFSHGQAPPRAAWGGQDLWSLTSALSLTLMCP